MFASGDICNEKNELIMTGNIKNIIAFKGGNQPQDEMWNIQQVLPAVGLSMNNFSEVHIDIKYLFADKLNQLYIVGHSIASGHDLGKYTLTPFNDRDGDSGMVVKVFS